MFVRSVLISILLIIISTVNPVIAKQDQTLDIGKIQKSEIFNGPYSYFVPPYSNYYFHNMQKLRFQKDWIHHGELVYQLREPIKPFTVTYEYNGNTYDLNDYFKRNQVIGFLVLKDDQIISEQYFHGADIDSKFLSNSMQKSITATLVGIALEEGKIQSLDDPVTKYLPALSGSGFNRVSIKQLLMMASGIDTNESYNDIDSGIYQFIDDLIHGTENLTVYLGRLQAKHDIEPGSVFDYESVNSQVLGMLLERITGMPLNQYLEKMIWKKIGAQSDAFLYRSFSQSDQCAFGCFNATLRDYGRFGLMMLNRGKLGTNKIVGADWVKDATMSHIKTKPDKSDSHGYGYQWWIPADNHDGVYAAIGVFGQIIYVDSIRHVVIVETSAWPAKYSLEKWNEMYAVMHVIAASIT